MLAASQPEPGLSASPYDLPVMFSPDLREGVAAGEITLSVRLWQRAKVKAGGRYASHGATIEVDSIELLPFAAISDEDVARSGESDREAMRQRAAHAGPITEDTLVYRVEFHVVASRTRDLREDVI
jgi:hypothetical protein